MDQTPVARGVGSARLILPVQPAEFPYLTRTVLPEALLRP
jgi:hypothetical protein